VSPVAQAPEQVSDRSSEIRQALADYTLNNYSTTGAPQQTVVNGWIAKDLLTIMAEQQNEALTRDEVPAPPPPPAPADERIPALIGLVVVGLALALATAPRSPASTPETAAAPTAERPDELVAQQV
jgi:hypothetical protein